MLETGLESSKKKQNGPHDVSFLNILVAYRDITIDCFILLALEVQSSLNHIELVEHRLW